MTAIRERVRVRARAPHMESGAQRYGGSTRGNNQGENYAVFLVKPSLCLTCSRMTLSRQLGHNIALLAVLHSSAKEAWYALSMTPKEIWHSRT